MYFNLKIKENSKFGPSTYITVGGSFMEYNDDFFKKIEKKTKVNKDTIVNLAKKIQENNLKDESTLGEVIDTLSLMTGKKVSKEQRERIISTIVNDNVPGNVDKMF